jgi:DNA-directed RNA polymerase specialized sigma24 family protein
MDVNSVQPVKEKKSEKGLLKKTGWQDWFKAFGAVKPLELAPLLLLIEGFSYTEVSQICGWSLAKVKKRIFKLKKRLILNYRDFS